MDNICGRRNVSTKEIMRTIAPTFQASGLDGEVMALTLPARGLYVAQRIESVPIPDSSGNLKDLRKCIRTLLYLKVNCVVRLASVLC